MSVNYPTGSRLAGKVALISGGARGMGESHARAMVAQGAKVDIQVFFFEAELAPQIETW